MFAEKLPKKCASTHLSAADNFFADDNFGKINQAPSEILMLPTILVQILKISAYKRSFLAAIRRASGKISQAPSDARYAHFTSTVSQNAFYFFSVIGSRNILIKVSVYAPKNCWAHRV